MATMQTFLGRADVAYIQTFIRKQKQRVGGRMTIVADRDHAAISIMAPSGECILRLDLIGEEIDRVLNELRVARQGEKVPGFAAPDFLERGAELKIVAGFVEEDERARRLQIEEDLRDE